MQTIENKVSYTNYANITIALKTVVQRAEDWSLKYIYIYNKAGGYMMTWLTTNLEQIYLQYLHITYLCVMSYFI